MCEKKTRVCLIKLGLHASIYQTPAGSFFIRKLEILYKVIKPNSCAQKLACLFILIFESFLHASIFPHTSSKFLPKNIFQEKYFFKILQ